MKKLTTTLSIITFLISILLFACNTNSQNAESATDAKETTTPANTEQTAVVVNTDSLVKVINSQRAKIEATIEKVKPIEIATNDLRAKVRQKWSNIHFYTNNGEVVRIKTYPHSQISTRTEEFYLNDGALMLAVIEDNGEGKRGKSSESIDKMYYFNDGELIKEMHESKESEYSIKYSDAEELLVEVAEYLDIYAKAEK